MMLQQNVVVNHIYTKKYSGQVSGNQLMRRMIGDLPLNPYHRLMSALRRLFQACVSLLLTYFLLGVILAGFLFWAPHIWSPPLKNMLQQRLSSSLSAQAKIGEIKFSSFWPVTLQVGGIEIANQLYTAKVEVATLAIALRNLLTDWHRPKVEIKLEVKSPHVVVQLASPKANSDVTSTYLFELEPPSPSGMVVVDFPLLIKIQQGNVSVFDSKKVALANVENINFNLSVDSVRSPIIRPQLDLKADVKSGVISVPVGLELKQIEVSREGLRVEKGVFNLGRLIMSLSASHKWREGESKAQMQMSESEVKDMPIPLIPIGQWSGKLNGVINYSRTPTQPGRLEGQFSTDALRGEVETEQFGTKLKGNVSLLFKTRFAYQDDITIDDATAELDLSQTQVSYLPWFDKPAQIPMYVNLVSDLQQQSLALRRLTVKIADLQLQGVGTVNLGGSQLLNFNAKLLPIALMGLEKIFPPLAAQPAKGRIDGQVQINGSAQDFSRVQVELTELNLLGVEAAFDTKLTNGLSTKGVVAANMQVKAQLSGKSLKNIHVKGRTDLTRLAIDWPDKLKKSLQQKMVVELNGSYQNDAVTVAPLRLNLNKGYLQMGGYVGLKGDYAPRISLKAQGLSLTDLRRLFPLTTIDIEGDLGADLAFTGRYSLTEGFMASPLVVKGNIQLSNLKLNLPPPLPTADDKAGAAAPKPASSLLPEWPVFRNSDISYQIKTGVVKKQNLVISGIDFSGQFRGGVHTSRGVIASLFGGQVYVDQMTVTPLVTPSGLEGQVRWQQLDMDQLFTWFSAKLKNYSRGRLQGGSAFVGTYTGEADWYKSLKIEGQAQVINGQFTTWNIEKVINEKLSKVNLLKQGGVKNDPLPFTAQTKFIFHDASLDLKSFRLLTAGQDELQAQGQVDLDLNANLVGNVYIASARLGGAIAAANRDKTGRLAIPVQVRGSLLEPSFSFADATYKGLLENAAKAEGEKLKDKFKEDLQENLKKKMKNLFGK